MTDNLMRFDIGTEVKTDEIKNKKWFTDKVPVYGRDIDDKRVGMVFSFKHYTMIIECSFEILNENNDIFHGCLVEGNLISFRTFISKSVLDKSLYIGSAKNKKEWPT